MTNTFENPSAGKFAPPPAHRDPLKGEPFYKRWWFGPLVFLAYVAKLWMGRGQAGGATHLGGLLVGLGLLAIQFLKGRAVQQEGEDTPYSPPKQVTR